MQNSFEPDYIVTPGETLREALEHHRVSIEECARRTKRSKQFIIDLIDGKERIGGALPIYLQEVTDIPAAFWWSLQKQYDNKLRGKNEKRNSDTQTD